MANEYSKEQGFVDDLVAMTRNDQAFRDIFSDFVNYDEQSNSLHENIMNLPGTAVECMIEALHAGCVGRNNAGDFSEVCTNINSASEKAIVTRNCAGRLQQDLVGRCWRALKWTFM